MDQMGMAIGPPPRGESGSDRRLDQPSGAGDAPRADRDVGAGEDGRPAGPPNMWSVSGLSQTMACAAGEGVVYVKSHGSQTWEIPPLSDPTTLQGYRLRGVLCPTAKWVVAVGSQKGGTGQPGILVIDSTVSPTLTVFKPLAGGNLFDLASISGGQVVTVGTKTGTAGTKPTAVGLTSPSLGSGPWSSLFYLSASPPLRGVWSQPDGMITVVGEAGTLLLAYSAFLPFYQQTHSLGSVNLRAVWSAGDGAFIVVGENNALLRRAKPGVWETMQSTVTEFVDWQDVHGISGSNAFAVGGAVLAHYDGTQWRRVTQITGLPSSPDLESLWIDAGVTPARLFLAGKGLLADCTIGSGTPPSVACTSSGNP
jgi:hypothetical protein